MLITQTMLNVLNCLFHNSLLRYMYVAMYLWKVYCMWLLCTFISGLPKSGHTKFNALHHNNIGLKNLFSTQAIHVFSGYEYFKVVSKISLPSPNGELSCTCIIISESMYSSVLAYWSKSEYYTHDSSSAKHPI